MRQDTLPSHPTACQEQQLTGRPLSGHSPAATVTRIFLLDPSCLGDPSPSASPTPLRLLLLGTFSLHRHAEFSGRFLVITGTVRLQRLILRFPKSYGSEKQREKEMETKLSVLITCSPLTSTGGRQSRKFLQEAPWGLSVNAPLEGKTTLV